MGRYVIYDGTQCERCGFVATVLDTAKQTFVVEDGQPIYDVVCECFSMSDAELVCAALNAREENERLREEICALSKDAQRWRWLERNAKLGFASLPSCDAVIRLPVFNNADNTIAKLVDRALVEKR
jgi:hypothetical protein